MTSNFQGKKSYEMTRVEVAESFPSRPLSVVTSYFKDGSLSELE